MRSRVFTSLFSIFCAYWPTKRKQNPLGGEANFANLWNAFRWKLPTFCSKCGRHKEAPAVLFTKYLMDLNFVCNQIVFLLQLSKPVVGEPASLQKQIGWKKVSRFFVFKWIFFSRTGLFYSKRLKRQLFVRQLDTVHLLGISTPSKVAESYFPSRILRNDIFSFMISQSHLIFYSFRVTAEGIFQAFFTALRSSFEKAYILLSLLNHKIVFSGECTPWEGKRQRSGSRKTSTQLN